MRELTNYLEYLKYQKNYSNYTIKSYEQDILEYFKYLKIKKISFLNVDYHEIRGFLQYVKEEKKKSNSSIDRSLSSLRGFYRFLADQKIITHNVFSSVSGLKKEKKLPRYFEYNELEELFKVPNLTTPLGCRDRLLLELLYATGVRVGELIKIKTSDIDQSRRTILILGKGNKERLVEYGEYCEESLELYFKEGYPILNIKKIPYLFLNKNGNVLTERGVRYILDKIIKKTSLHKRISPHMIRHSFATQLLNEGCDLLTVQKLLGHSSISATQVYTHVSTDRLKEVYYQSFPRAKISSKKDK